MSMFDGVKVLYKLVDPSIATDTRTDTPSSSSAFSDTANLDNLLNKKKGAYLEKDYFVLDGTHTFLTAGDDVGWESENLSNNVDSEVPNSLLTITDSSDNNLIALKEIVGNTVGATSITSPIGLTVCGKNLYNINSIFDAPSGSSPKINTVSDDTMNVMCNISRYQYTGQRFKVKPNTYYTLQFNVISWLENSDFRVRIRAKSDDYWNVVVRNFTLYGLSNIIGKKSFVFYSGENNNELMIAFGGSVDGLIGTINGIQIEEGSTETSYEPYNGTDYSIPLKKSNGDAFSLPSGTSLLLKNDKYIYDDGTNEYDIHADTYNAIRSIKLKNGLSNIFIKSAIPADFFVVPIFEWVAFEFANTHDSYGLTVNFPTNSFAKDFTIVYYAGASVLHTTTVTDNATANYRDNSDVFGWDKIVIAITKVNPQQRARIWSVVFGINEEWNGDDIIKITASKVTDLTAEKVESGEVEFDVYNDGVFDIQDIKDLSPEVQRNIGIEVSFRRSGAYVKFGTYKSAGTQVADKGKLITITGYDEFYRIGQTYFETGKIPSAPKSLGAWAEEVAADCGLELEIDASLYDIYSNGYIGYVPHREALRLIAEAGNCILVVDSDGKNYIKPHVPSVYGAITDDNIIADSSEISNADKLDGVVVERYTYALSSTASGLAEIQGIALTGSPQTIWIDYSVYPAVVDSIASSANITIDNEASVWYSDRAKIVFTGTASETGWITILGYAYGVSTTSYTAGSTGNVKTISNSLITEDSVATSVLAYQWSRAENKYKYTADVYVDSDVNLGDSVTYDDNTIYVTKITRSLDSDEARETIEGIDA